MSYRRRSSQLHAARASCACLWCLSLVCAALILGDPVGLAAVTVAVLLAGAGARVGRELARAALLALPAAVLITVVNALVSRPLTKFVAWSFEGSVVSTPPPSSPYAP